MPIQGTVRRKKAVKFVEYVHDYTKSMEEQELDAMRWLGKHFSEHPVRLMKTIQSLRGKVPEWFEKSLCDVAYHVPDLVKWVKLCLKESERYPEIMQQFRDEGNHGMIFYKHELYGFNLETRANWLDPKTGLWDKEFEKEIMLSVLENWMIKHRVRKFNDRIMLFAEYGFSGVPIMAQVEMDAESWATCQEMYKAEDDAAELKQLMQVAMSKD